MSRFLYRRMVSQGWIQANDDFEGGRCGVVLNADGEQDYITEPAGIYSELTDICRKLELESKASMLMSTQKLIWWIPMPYLMTPLLILTLMTQNLFAKLLKTQTVTSLHSPSLKR